MTTNRSTVSNMTPTVRMITPPPLICVMIAYVSSKVWMCSRIACLILSIFMKGVIVFENHKRKVSVW